ncbi:hypothetical protein BJX63DRAFT_139192 [Aspergillus granulosus]|uniref:Uncharacterized protein n=1 Tax=Aspergillus granulosus TaxID=176169 RepID=A0ABR4HM49_9EURO
MNAISRWLFGTREYRVHLLGHDACGKTSLLRRLAFNSVPEDLIPTEFFEVETVTYPANHSWVIWEMRTTRRNLPLIYRGFNPYTLVLWLHDCTRNDEGLPDTFEQVADEMVRRGCRFLWVGLNKQDDSSVNEKIVQEARQMYGKALLKYKGDLTWKIFPHKLSGKTGEGTIELLDEFHDTVRKVNLMEWNKVTQEMITPNPQLPQEPRPEEDLSTEQLHTRLQEHIQQDALDADAFWTGFLKGELPKWNHYTHLRAVYFLILNSERKGDVWKLGEDVAAALTGFKIKAPKLLDAMPPRFSVTLSTFWTLQLQRTIQAYRKYTMSPDLPSCGEFNEVLRHSPFLMNQHLWVAHYSYDPDKRRPAWPDRFSAPDLRRLDMQTEYLADPATLPVPSSGPDKLLRYAYGVMQYVRKTGTQCGVAVEDALVALQQAIIRSRRYDETVPSYSETQAYFWIQIVDAALRSLDGARKEKPIETDGMSFGAFQQIFAIDPESWKQYYTKKVWEGTGSRSRFVMPDRRPLPSVIAFDEERARRMVLLDRSNDLKPPLPPSIEERLFRFRMLRQEIADEDQLSTPSITSHGHLIFYLYTAFTKQDNDNDGKPKTLAQRARILFSELSGPMVAGATQRNFWIQQVGVAMSHSMALPVSGTDHSTLAEFITSNAHLVFDNLPAVYYGPAVWNSAEARERIVAADRRRMGQIVELGEESEGEDWVHVKTG